MRRLIFLAAGLVAAAALWVGLSKPQTISVGHNPSHSVSCEDGITQADTHYPAGTVATSTLDSTVRTMTVSDQDQTVYGVWVGSNNVYLHIPNPDKTKPHTYEMTLASSDGSGNYTVKGTIQPCQGSPSTVAASTVPAPSIVATTTASTTASTTSGPPSSAPSTTGSTAVTVSTSLAPPAPSTAATSSSVPVPASSTPPVEPEQPPVTPAAPPTFPGGTLPPTR